MNETIDIREAAKFLGFTSTQRLSEKAKRGEIPAFKAGRNWMFYMPDLVQWTRDQYNARREAAQVGIVGGNKQWQSLRRKADVICIQNSRSAASELMNLRKQIREQKLKSTKKSAGEK